MRKHTISEAKNDICSIIRESEAEEVFITRHGKPAAIAIWFHDERFFNKITKARNEIKKGQYISLDDLPEK